jgi:hypothetical protein
MLYGVWEWPAIGNGVGKLVGIPAASRAELDEKLLRRSIRTWVEFEAQDEQDYALKAEGWRQSRAMDSYNGSDNLPGR